MSISDRDGGDGASPKAVFDVLTRIEALPSCNDTMTRVVDKPAGALDTRR